MKQSLKSPVLLLFSRVWLASLTASGLCLTLRAAPFDAAPFGLPLPQGNGVMWEDPREIHRVVVHFKDGAPAPESVHLEYWASRWPEQHLPKDREPGGGNVGWMELGNWYTYRWRAADTEAKADGNAITFTFRPVNAKEFPNLKDYPAAFRYTLKLRVVSEAPLPKIERIEAFTDSILEPRAVNLAWKSASADKASFEVFNGAFEKLEQTSSHSSRLKLRVVANTDPNTLDRTLVTVRNGQTVFTFAVDDLKQGAALHSPRRRSRPAGRRRAQLYGRGRRPKGRGRQDPLRPRGGNARADLARRLGRHAAKEVPPLPAARAGQRAAAVRARCRRLRAVSLERSLPAGAARQETPRLLLEPAPVRFRFQLPLAPVFRTVEDACLPIGHTVWETNGVRILQIALATELNGARADGPVPAADTFAVCLAKFVLTNLTASPQVATLPVTYETGDTAKALRRDDQGLLWLGDNVRGQVLADTAPSQRSGNPPLDLDARTRRKQDGHGQDSLPGADPAIRARGTRGTGLRAGAPRGCRLLAPAVG